MIKKNVIIISPIVPFILCIFFLGCRNEKSKASMEDDLASRGDSDRKETSMEERIERFVLLGWLEPQNKGDVGAYARVLSDDFEGKIMTSTGETKVMPKDKWLERRAKALDSRPAITVKDMHIDSAGENDFTVRFFQTWETEIYCDQGEKVLKLRESPSGLVVLREEMASVEECSWDSKSTFFSFVRRYKRAWKEDDTRYIVDHTCFPFKYREVDKSGTEREVRVETINKTKDIFRDDIQPAKVLVEAEFNEDESYQKLFGICKYMVKVTVVGEETMVSAEQSSCSNLDNYWMQFLFQDGKWKYCSYKNTYSPGKP